MTAPWYPPGEGWVEWAGGENPVPGKMVNWLLRHERAHETYDPFIARSEHVFSEKKTTQKELSVVAYRVVTPAPTPSADRDALFGEMEAVIEEGRRAIGDHYAPNDCYATGPLTGDPIRDLVECPACTFINMYDAYKARAVLAKVREASK
jgi:hypothetical protein